MKVSKVSIILAVLALLVISTGVCGYFVLQKYTSEFHHELPILIENKSPSEWLLLFLPFVQGEGNADRVRVTLPPVINKLEIGREVRQFAIIKRPIGRESATRVYWGTKVDAKRFCIVVLSWKVGKDENLEPNKIVEYCRKRQPEQVFILRNEKYQGQLIDYAPFANIWLEG